MSNWNDIEVALMKSTIESLDKSTLEAFTQVEPPVSQNPAFHIRFEQAQQRIGRALAKIYAKEREEKEETRHREIHDRLEELKRPHWTVLPNFWLTAISAVAAVAAAYLAWLALKK
jgi:hypothetical protein